MTRRNREATSNRLDGSKFAAPGKRVGAALLDGFLLTVVQTLVVAVSWGGILRQLAEGTAPEQVEAGWLPVPALVALALTVFYAIWVWTRGLTPGYALLGLRMVDWNYGRAPRGRGLLWFLLAGLVGSVSLWIAPLVLLLQPDSRGRNWLDRTAGTFVVDTRAGADPLRRSAPQELPAWGQQPVDPDEELGATIMVNWQGEGQGLPVPTGPLAVQPAGDVPMFAPSVSGEPAHPPLPAEQGPVSPLPQAEPFITSVPWEAAGPVPQVPVPSPQAAGPSPQGPVPWGEPQPPAWGPVPPGEPTPLPSAEVPASPFLPQVPPAPVTPPVQAVPLPAAPSAVDNMVPVPPQPVPPAPSLAVPGPADAVQSWDQLAATALSGRRSEPLLRVDTGQVVALTTERTVLGRAPVAHGEWAQAAAVPVEDPERSVSKTHLGVIATAQGLWLQDFGSTNGTTIVMPDATEVVVEGPEASLLPEGACIRMGERLIAVER